MALEQEYSHVVHIYAFSREWVNSCCFIVLSQLVLNSHWLQINRFSPVCLEMCFLRILDVDVLNSHWLQIKGFFSSVFINVLSQRTSIIGRIVALCALVRLFPSVKDRMLLQMIISAECFVAL